MIEKLIGVLDDYVAEHGYGRLGATVMTVLGVGGVLSTLFGTTWFRLISVTVVAIAAVLVLLLGIAERRRLYARIERDANMINRYVDLVSIQNPFHVKKWHQTVVISANGDCVISIEQTISPVDDAEPHFVKLNSIYYGSMPLSERAKRRVKQYAFFRNGGGKNRNVRAYSTYSWVLSVDGKPKHNVVVHLTSRVRNGDVVTVEWRWPKFSADLRSARSAELFDVLFTNQVIDFRYEIRLKDVGGVQPAITRQRLRSIDERWDGDDYVVVFSAKNPAPGTRIGVELDMQPRTKKQAV
ncbi:hypothetical protein ACFVYA_38635 [Amycolatopsis sp. NPDC058278]|uniref:hypothetical protein n=1 Tax=Amycolatopsis sp. NPDC058278 TaxID=3346417 RepID=UPI0036DE93C6